MIGIDTVRISRIKKAIENAAFKDRVFTAAEQSYCNGKANCSQSYAGIFCAKEAAVKALGIGFGSGVMPSDIEVVHGDSGAPALNFCGGAVEKFKPYFVSVSISHDGDYAVAVVELLPKGDSK
ncbi:MAG: holo-ACP synthase [Clostridiales bacterium]|nr:holo-ACP synthase [Clostridiales bacterium]